MRRYLLDTCVLSALTWRTPPAGLVARMERDGPRCAIAAPTWYELRFDVDRLPPSARRAALEAFLRDVVLPAFPILAYDRPCAEWHAAARARLACAGTARPFADLQIAAIAAAHRLTLVTANVAHVAGLDGLDVEDWVTGG